MTDKKHPEALAFCWATELAMTQQPVTLSVTEAREVSAEMQRLHAENETLRVERERNLNSIRVCNEIINKKNAELESLRTGYAAARLEIESLQARIKTMAEEHADELMVAHLDGRMRAAQPAGAQQPGAAYAALPDADRDYMRKVVAVAVTMLFDGYKEDVTRVFSTGELSEFVTITAAMRGEQVEDIYRRAWDLLSLPSRASHGQTPAQAAPAAAAAPNWTDAANWLRNNYQDYPNIVSLCEGMIAASPYANTTCALPINWENAMPGGKHTDKWESSRAADYNRGWNAYRKEARKKLKELAAAPTTQPAPQQEAPAMPSGWVTCTIEFDGSGPEVVAYGPKIMMDRLAKWIGKHFERTIAEKAAPQPSPTPQADSQPAPANTRQIAECYGDCPTDPKTCANPCKFEGRAARAPADSVTAPAGGEIDCLRAALVYVAFALHDKPQYMLAEGIALIDGYTVRVSRDGWTVEASINPARATSPAQAADSVLEDAARLDWLLLRISGAEFRRIGVHYSGNARRADVDAARKQGANHD